MKHYVPFPEMLDVANHLHFFTCIDRFSWWSFFYLRALHLSIINMKPMETDAIISVAPCRECLDIYNDLKQVNNQKTTTYLAYFSSSLATSECSNLEDNRCRRSQWFVFVFLNEICVIFSKDYNVFLVQFSDAASSGDHYTTARGNP